MNTRELDVNIKVDWHEGEQKLNELEIYLARGYDPSDESDYESDSDEQTWEEEDDDSDYEEDDDEGEDY